jgi:hypothetical protein
MTTKELQNILTNIKNKPIFIQCGFNRFSITTTYEYSDYLVLVVEDDANNPESDVTVKRAS